MIKRMLFKAYKYILRFCNKTMKARIKAQADYNTRIKGNVSNLLKDISCKMYDLIRSKYEYMSLTQLFKRLLNTKQEEDESLIDYMKRFKQARDVLKSY